MKINSIVSELMRSKYHAMSAANHPLGDTITLSANGAVAGSLQAVLGDSTVVANGVVITLAEGQTQVSFALVSSSAIEADVVGALSVSYAGCKHYRKRSCSRNILLAYRAKLHMKTSSTHRCTP